MLNLYLLNVPETTESATAELFWVPDFNGWVLHHLTVPPAARGQGYGSALLRRVLADADAERVNVLLAPEPSGPLDRSALVRWYQRYGFVWIRAGAMMERFPRLPGHG